MVFETRPGVHAAYARRGPLAHATTTVHGAELLARMLKIEPPAGASWS